MFALIVGSGFTHLVLITAFSAVLEESGRSHPVPGYQLIKHWIDNVLFSHGGLTVDFLRWLNEELLGADIDEVVAAVNDASQNYLWNDESPLWLRPQNRTVNVFQNDAYTQVVGHTPVEKIFEKDGIISTDVFSTYRDGTQIGESAMIVIDSETGKYEKIKVPGKLGYKIETVSEVDD